MADPISRLCKAASKDIVAVDNPDKGFTVNDRKPAHIIINHKPGRIGKRCPARNRDDLLCHQVPDGSCAVLGNR